MKHLLSGVSFIRCATSLLTFQAQKIYRRRNRRMEKIKIHSMILTWGVRRLLLSFIFDAEQLNEKDICWHFYSKWRWLYHIAAMQVYMIFHASDNLIFQQWVSFSRTWWIYDAKWQCPFKSAFRILHYLDGKHKPIWHPNGKSNF